jgi:hypothetical protein
MHEQQDRVGGSAANPIYRVVESSPGQTREKFIVGETGVAFDTLEAAEAAARELDSLTPPPAR